MTGRLLLGMENRDWKQKQANHVIGFTDLLVPHICAETIYSISFYLSCSNLEMCNVLCSNVVMGQREPTDLIPFTTFPTSSPTPLYLTCHTWGLLTCVSASVHPLSSHLQLLSATWIPHFMTLCKEILCQEGFQDNHYPVTLCRPDYRTSTALSQSLRKAIAISLLER